MILLTGGAGFIGSVLLKLLNDNGINDICIVDRLGDEEKWKNLQLKSFQNFIHKDDFNALLKKGELPENVTEIIHLGACSSTTEKNLDYLMDNNFLFSKRLAELALAKKIPFLYASSAATYGDGKYGFDDDVKKIAQLEPLNGYGFSKHIFDRWILTQKWSSQVVGMKFFNVYGPNEYHKGSMKSLVERAYHQVLDTGKIKLFKSEHPDYLDGEQKRDFVYVKDVASVIYWFIKNPDKSGIFNIGTGKANTWLSLANAIFSSLGKTANIEFIPIPEILKEKYQYFTLAPTEKLRAAGCDVKFMELDAAVSDYVKNHLLKENKYL